MKRILVAGGRDFWDQKLVWRVLERVHEKYHSFVLVHGDCRTGADFLANLWAAELNTSVCSTLIHVERHPADWSKGKGAGPARNQEMVDSGLDGAVIFPGGRGTADITRRCAAAGVPVMTIRDRTI